MSHAIYGWEVFLKDYREIKGYTRERFESLHDDEKRIWHAKFRFNGHHMNYTYDQFLSDWFIYDDDEAYSVLEKYGFYEKRHGYIGVLGIKLLVKKDAIDLSDVGVSVGVGVGVDVEVEVIYNLTLRRIPKEICKQIMDYYIRWKKTSCFDELFNSEYKQLLIGEPKVYIISY